MGLYQELDKLEREYCQKIERKVKLETINKLASQKKELEKITAELGEKRKLHSEILAKANEEAKEIIDSRLAEIKEKESKLVLKEEELNAKISEAGIKTKESIEKIKQADSRKSILDRLIEENKKKEDVLNSKLLKIKEAGLL